MSSSLEDAARQCVKDAVFPGGVSQAVALRRLVAAVMDADSTPKRDALIRDLAASMFQKDELGIDADAVVSEGDDNGAYVHVWVWVPFSGTKLSKICDDCDQAIPIGKASEDGLCDVCQPQHKCTRCGVDASGGEGWNGLCGNCADREESTHGTQAQP